jgi:nicotinate-nucleotide pyrophosphorylase (carboxylating)
MQLNTEHLELIDQLIRLALREDIGDGDHTSLACVQSDVMQKARLLVKEDGILSGVAIAQRVAELVDRDLKFDIKINDGATIHKGDVAFYIEGSARSILTAERLMLNILQRMSGIATNTRRLVDLVKHTGVSLLDTRKTGPGMRVMEKLAVLHGGGKNHRMGLYDMVMIKDNHADYAGGVVQAIQNVKSYLKQNQLNLDIEVESRNLNEVQLILEVRGYSSPQHLGLPLTSETKAFLDRKCKYPGIPLSTFIPEASFQAVNLIEELLQLNPSKRPSATESLSNGFFLDAQVLSN